jgi:hypothetical protein
MDQIHQLECPKTFLFKPECVNLDSMPMFHTLDLRQQQTKVFGNNNKLHIRVSSKQHIWIFKYRYFSNDDARRCPNTTTSRQANDGRSTWTFNGIPKYSFRG